MKEDKKQYTTKILEQILEYIPYEVWVKDEENKYIYANKQIEKNLNLKKEDIIGKTDKEIRNEFFWNKCKETDSLILKDKKPLFYEERIDFDNKHNYYNVFKFPLIGDNNELLSGGISQEITYSKHIQKEVEYLFNEVQQSKNKNEETVKSISNILDTLNKIIGSKSTDLFFISSDKKKLKLSIGSSSQKIFLENSTIDINYNEFSKLYKDKLEIRENDILNIRFKEIYNKDISTNDKTVFKLIPLTIKDNLVGIMYIYYEEEYEYMNFHDAFIFDVSYRINNFIESIKVQDELQEELYKSKEKFKSLEKGINDLKETIESEIIKINFLENMSHEFRTPINVTLATLQILISIFETDNCKKSKEEILSYLYSLNRNSYRILRLVNNVLDSANFDNKSKKIETNNYNIIYLIEDIIFAVSKYIKNTNKTIMFDTDEEEVVLACNPIFIEKIILNLISNSLKFTKDDGNIEVEIKTDRENKRLYVYLRNDGENIKKENAKLIFSKFVQVENHIRRKNEGSGIGLYVAKQLVESHNGEIWVNTEVKSGVEFVFYIPIIELKDEDVKEYSTIDNLIYNKCNIEFSDVYLPFKEHFKIYCNLNK